MCATTLSQNPFCKRSNVMDLSCLVSDQAPLSPRTCSSSSSSSSSSSPRNEFASGPSYFTFSVPAAPSFPSVQSPPPTPAEDHWKCSLPSISSLLETAGDAPSHASKRQRPNPSLQQREYQGKPQDFDPIMVNGRPVHLPLTPPLVSESQYHRQSHSPSVSSASHHSASDAMRNANSRSPDLYPVQHQHHQQQQPLPSISSPPPSAIPTQRPPGPSPPYGSPTLGAVSYTSPVGPSAPASLYYYPGQSPVPSLQSPGGSQAITPVTPTWQQHHHHYFPPSSTASYQQTQDRYVCRVCNKAFSRPSSLRIHSYSHTGEKPFRCTHAGCGKSFSVRSNMKRHERGCHPSRPAAALL